MSTSSSSPWHAQTSSTCLPDVSGIKWVIEWCCRSRRTSFARSAAYRPNVPWTFPSPSNSEVAVDSQPAAPVALS